jgi:hypothetical protein
MLGVKTVPRYLTENPEMIVFLRYSLLFILIILPFSNFAQVNDTLPPAPKNFRLNGKGLQVGAVYDARNCLLFDLGQPDFRKESLYCMDSLINLLIQHKKMALEFYYQDVRINFEDSTLVQKRVNVVKNYMTEKGIPEERISIKCKAIVITPEEYEKDRNYKYTNVIEEFRVIKF